MTVSELIAWLKTQDQEAIVEVLTSRDGQAYQGDIIETAEFDPSVHADYTDFRGNGWTKADSPHFNKRFLFLGEKA